MNLPEVLARLFPKGHQVTVQGQALWGSASTEAGEISVIGTTEHAEIGIEMRSRSPPKSSTWCAGTRPARC